MTAIFRDDQFFPIRGHDAVQWRADVVQAGGGCLIEHWIDDVDILRFCFGEVTQVSAWTANFAGHAGVEDLGRGDAVVRVGLRGAADQCVARHPLSRGPTRRIEVFCREGMVRAGATSSVVRCTSRLSGAKEVRDCPSPVWVDALPPLADDETGLALRAYVEADREFLDALVAGRAPELSLAEAVQAHRLVDVADVLRRKAGCRWRRTEAGIPGIV